MDELLDKLPLISYGLAAVLFLSISLLVLANWRGQLRVGLLAAAVIMTTIWSALLASGSLLPVLAPFREYLPELLRDLLWVLFLGNLLAPGTAASSRALVRWGGPAVITSFLVAGLASQYGGAPEFWAGNVSSLPVFGALIAALLVLVYLEQVYRNSRGAERKSLRYFCAGAGGIFIYDVFLYSEAMVSGQIGVAAWEVRGFVVAMCAPFIAVGVRHSKLWATRIFVSRKVVFYTTTLVAAGTYLTTLGIAGYYIRIIGGTWGSVGQILFVSAGMLALLLLFFSEQLRAKVRVFITKHFFENKYDYREEWLRLIETLTASGDTLPLKKRAIKSLAQILSSPSGRIWIKSDESSEFEGAAGWNVESSNDVVSDDSALIRFMRDTGWVIDANELNSHPERYSGLKGDDLENLLDDLAYVIPLINEAELLGFVALSRPESLTTLNYEDRDLLKTVGKQIAGFIAQEKATELLLQSRQFEAFNRLTAYIMHDLKNLISQQSLMVENARKYKDKPEFIDDAVATVESGVRRMRRVIEQLQQSTRESLSERIDARKIVLEAVSRCSDREPVPTARLCEKHVLVMGNKERLLMALYHTIRNAQDATDSGGTIYVDLLDGSDECRIVVTDNGKGMDAVFIKERLFRPFDSTKGTQGMGIGAYQVRETARAMGGRVDVSSEPGKGTVFSFILKAEA